MPVTIKVKKVPVDPPLLVSSDVNSDPLDL